MPKLTVQQGYGDTKEFALKTGATTLGRGTGNTLALNSEGISRHHARITVESEQSTLEDLDSRNGTFINGRPVRDKVNLKHGDVVQLGEIVLVFEQYDYENTTITDHRPVADFGFPELQKVVTKLCESIGWVIRGKDDIIRKVVLAILSDGHVLLEDVPGVGKTMLANSLAKSIRSDFKRIQFTPDMLPTDITGVNIFDEKTRAFSFVPGPVFANVVLADEINRGTPRTQSSLLECMAEAAVTVDGKKHVLQKPFFVIATQNPEDFHGTYPLPEAQLDRFLMRLSMGYPDHETERDILASRVSAQPLEEISAVVHTADIMRCQALVRTVHVSEVVMDYIVTLVNATRSHPAFNFGCSPRASLALMRVSQSLAASQGRDHVLPRDVRDMAVCTLSHRLMLKLQAQAEWERADKVVADILDKHPLERWEA